MQASAKIDELSFEDSRARPRPAAVPAPVWHRLRAIYEKQAVLHEESARLLEAQAAALARRIELAS